MVPFKGGIAHHSDTVSSTISEWFEVGTLESETEEKNTGGFEQWLARERLEIERRRVALEEREAASRNQQRDGAPWRSPLVIAILGATTAAIGNAALTLIDGVQSRQLARLEGENTRILSAIETADPDLNAENLRFLLEAGLIESSDMRLQISRFLEERTPGSGPALSLPTSFEQPFERRLYTDWDLDQTRRRMAENVRFMVERDFVDSVPEAFKDKVRSVRVVFEEDAVHPLFFFARKDTMSVHISVASLRFLDELAILQAWWNHHGCDPEAISTYLHLALNQLAPVGAPLEAFEVQRSEALAIPSVDEVSLRLLNSGAYFFIAKEVAHLLLQHEIDPDSGWNLNQELAADALALSMMKRIGSPPAGIGLYFIAYANLEDRFLRASGTSRETLRHRIAAISDSLTTDRESFVSAEADPGRLLRFVERLGTYLDDLAIKLSEAPAAAPDAKTVGSQTSALGNYRCPA